MPAGAKAMPSSSRGYGYNDVSGMGSAQKAPVPERLNMPPTQLDVGTLATPQLASPTANVSNSRMPDYTDIYGPLPTKERTQEVPKVAAQESELFNKLKGTQYGTPEVKQVPVPLEKAFQQVTPQPGAQPDKGLNFVLTKLEGPDLIAEKDGSETGYSKYGIGFGNSKLPLDQVKNMTPDQAEDIFKKKYLKGSQYDLLNDPRDKVAYAQYVLHRPAYAQDFIKKYQGKPGDAGFRDALFADQASRYDPKSPNYKGWMNRIETARNYSPEQGSIQ